MLPRDCNVSILFRRHQGLLWSTDRGSQYAYDSHRALLKDQALQEIFEYTVETHSRLTVDFEKSAAHSTFVTLATFRVKTPCKYVSMIANTNACSLR